MGKPHPVELRERVVGFVEEGHGHREAARHFRVSPHFVNDMMKLYRETGSVAPRPQGRRGHGKLAGHEDWVRHRVAGQGGVTLDELRRSLEAEKGVKVHTASVGAWLHRLGLSFKKNPARQ